jgi:hypothetical protein
VPKCVELRTPPSAIKLNLEKRDLRNKILKYDVNHDALKVRCNENLKRPRNLGDNGSFGDINTSRN